MGTRSGRPCNAQVQYSNTRVLTRARYTPGTGPQRSCGVRARGCVGPRRGVAVTVAWAGAVNWAVSNRAQGASKGPAVGSGQLHAWLHACTAAGSGRAGRRRAYTRAHASGASARQCAWPTRPLTRSLDRHFCTSPPRTPAGAGRSSSHPGPGLLTRPHIEGDSRGVALPTWTTCSSAPARKTFCCTGQPYRMPGRRDKGRYC
jgi:hypothetical protein